MTDARKEDYWSEIEEEQDSVIDRVRSDAGEWDVRGAILAGETSDSLYLTVLRTRVGEDQQLLLSERYWYMDREDPSDHGWMSNGITRRVNGKLVEALGVLYKALSNGDATSESPILMDSTGDGIDHNPDVLTEALGQLIEEPDHSETEQSGESGEARYGSPTETDAETVTCGECRAEIPREEAVNFGNDNIGDLWVCAGEHRGEAE